MGDIRRFFSFILLSLSVVSNFTLGQITVFPYSESFDSTPAPGLPPGWASTATRLSSGDFFTTTSSPRSSPQAAQSTNSLVSQSLISPEFDFRNRVPNLLEFYSSRSSTHISGFLVEASIDSGLTYSISLSDTIKHPGTTGYVLTSLPIPASLAQQPAARIRWRVLGGSGGTSGTIRFDDVRLTVLSSLDLGIVMLSSAPPFPTTETPLTLLCRIKNLGILQTGTYSVAFFLDANENGMPDPAESFSVQSASSLAPGDSAEFSAMYQQPLVSRTYDFIALVSLAGDEVVSNDQFRTTVNVGVSIGAIAINEIMYAPAGDEPEWVELVNATESVINLRNWKISDASPFLKTILANTDVRIPPKSFVVIAKDSTFFSFHSDTGSLVLIASFPALNNTTPDAVVVYDQTSRSIDSVLYSPSWGGQGGKSIERIDHFSPATDQANWITSIDSAGSTPGRINSNARLDFDLALQSASSSGSQINVLVKNSGRRPATQFDVRIYHDKNRNGIAEPGEEIVTFPSTAQLEAGWTEHFLHEWKSAPEGETRVGIIIDFIQDQRISNNTGAVSIVTRFSAQSLVINEILYEPLAGQNEWIELYHIGPRPVDLRQWSIADRPTESGTRNFFSISTGERLIHPGEFVLVAAESSVLSLFPDLPTMPGAQLIILDRAGGFSLGNEGDDVVLYDLTGAMIDSVRFSPSWHNPDVADTRGRSLERVSPRINANDRRNWGTSARAAGGTPGSRNSLFTTSLPANATLACSPNPFSPDGDGYEDVCIVKYHLPFPSSVVRLRIYDLRGRLIRLLADGEPAGSEGEIIWDGLDDQRRRARVGPYIVLLEAVGTQGASVSAKTVAVVATKL